MKIKKLAFALALGIAANPVWADRIGGNPRVDFLNDELVIPCVQLKNSNPDLEGLYFDVRLKRRGKSLNYGLVDYVPEDSDVCRRIGALAAFEDDDYDGSGDDDYNGFNIHRPGGGGKAIRLLVSCEIDDDDDSGRESEIEIEVRNLAPGNYRARLISGGEASEPSPEKPASRSGTEFVFTSEADDIDTALIAADFIQDNTVTGEILDASGDVVISANAICKIDD